ncbi:MAG: cell division protein ZapA [Lachnospiraceae bacterium]|nr:cell division protein ZapA [Lachnospiraceae bacterium]MEE3460885.1 cell division protein ZapA [Lachnospiraceae bacterium]
MADVNDVKVYINGRQYTISGSGDEEYIRSLASYIDKKLEEMTGLKSYKKLDKEMKDVLAYINFADDYFRAKHELSENEDNLQKIKDDFFEARNRIISLEEAREKALSETEKVKEESSNKLSETVKSMREKLEDMKNSHQKEIDDLKKDNQKKLDDIRDAHAKELEGKLKEYHEEIEKKQSEFQKDLEERQKEFNAELEKKQAEYQDALEKEREKIKHEQDDEKTRLEKTIEALRKESQDQKIEIVRLSERIDPVQGKLPLDDMKADADNDEDTDGTGKPADNEKADNEKADNDPEPAETSDKTFNDVKPDNVITSGSENKDKSTVSGNDKEQAANSDDRSHENQHTSYNLKKKRGHR